VRGWFEEKVAMRHGKGRLETRGVVEREARSIIIHKNILFWGLIVRQIRVEARTFSLTQRFSNHSTYRNE
jgi:hypothetical protein